MSRPPARWASKRGELCHYCGINQGTTADHIVPAQYKGPPSLWNLQPSCRSCNSGKSSDWPSCECIKCCHAKIRYALNTERVQLGGEAVDRLVNASFSLFSKPEIPQSNLFAIREIHARAVLIQFTFWMEVLTIRERHGMLDHHELRKDDHDRLLHQ